MKDISHFELADMCTKIMMTTFSDLFERYFGNDRLEIDVYILLP